MSQEPSRKLVIAILCLALLVWTIPLYRYGSLVVSRWRMMQSFPRIDDNDDSVGVGGRFDDIFDFTRNVFLKAPMQPTSTPTSTAEPTVTAAIPTQSPMGYPTPDPTLEKRMELLMNSIPLRTPDSSQLTATATFPPQGLSWDTPLPTP